MPEISAYCPECGRGVMPLGVNASVPDVAPLSRYAFMGAIAYFAVFPAIVFLTVPGLKGSTYVRFHSWQSLLLAAATVVVGILTRLLFLGISLFPFFGLLLATLLSGLVSLAVFFLWITVAIKAGLGDAYELPLIGSLAARLVNP